MEEKKKVIWKNWKLWIGIVTIIVAIMILLVLISRPKFEVTDFSMTSDITEYTYSANSETYKGKGLITTSKKSDTYLVAIKVILKSGGGKDSKSYCTMVMVNNGKGEFTTYDSADEGKISKPEYEFEILGYVKF